MADADSRESQGEVEYMVLGCGSIGYNVIEELEQETRSILVVDKDEKRVKDLLDQNYDAVTGDIRNATLFDTLRAPKVVFVLSNEKDANLAAVQAIKGRYPEAEVIARAMDPLSQNALEAAGAEFVIYPQEVVAKAAVHQIRRLHVTRIAQRLYKLLESWEGTLGIITHNNPDPDSISSAMALAAIARAASDRRLQVRILYEGNIGHQENRAFVNLLDIRMERITPQILNECRYLALVDASAPGVNNNLPPGTPINIVIDHHRSEDEAVAAAEFIDIRPGMGATASIMTQYLQDLDVPVDKKVATGLLYGIRADTRDFRRNVTPQDLNYVAFLLPLGDSDLLDKIMSPSLSKETLDVLGKAIQNRVIRSGYLFSNVGYIRNRDALPQAADYLINLEGVNTALIYGIGDTGIILTARSRDIRINLGAVLAEAFGEIGDAGGHPNMAAAVIPLSYFAMVEDKERLLSLIIDPILKKFENIVGLEKKEGRNEL
jgi:nanoRNase/pAp phosphatase (c-di-AMP/oligoRNAs hydrolase)